MVRTTRAVRESEPGLAVVTDLGELSIRMSVDHYCDAVSSWIHAVNEREFSEGRPETMKPLSARDISAFLGTGRAVALLEQASSPDPGLRTDAAWLPAGFSALTYHFVDGESGSVYELGGLIRSPWSRRRGLGLAATVAALELPRAAAALAIVAYANRASLPLFMSGLEWYVGVGAAVVSPSDLESRFPYLPEYSGDTIVDLSPVRDRLIAPA